MAVPVAFVSVRVVTVIGPVPGRPPRSRPRGSCFVNHRMSVTEISSVKKKDVVDWDDLGREMWDYLTGKGAAINYQFVNNTAKVPRDTGESAPRATWKLDGTLRITNGGEREQPGVMVQRWVEADITFSVDGAEGTVTADGQVVRPGVGARTPGVSPPEGA